ncbi:MAG TPA: hypothetical protein PLO75_08600, partial [Thermotogota bacterium]|nr:hypothetical protein [Thermotogota bacterium]
SPCRHNQNGKTPRFRVGTIFVTNREILGGPYLAIEETIYTSRISTQVTEKREWRIRRYRHAIGVIIPLRVPL